jgi:multiple sugar transport system substrate-binding protein
LAPTPVKLVWANQGGDVKWQAVREETIAAFERKHPHITIEKIHQTSGTGYLDKVQVMVSSGTQLDLFMTTPISVPAVAQRGLYIPLDTLMARDKFPVQDWTPAALSAYNFRGKQYGFPEELNYVVVAYNQDALGQVGERPPAADWTREQFVNLARRLAVRSGGETTRWGIGPVGAGLNPMLQLFWGDGGRIFDDEQDPRRSTFNTTPTVEALQWRADWALRLEIAPPAEQMAPAAAQNAFINGGLAMHTVEFIGFVTLAGAIKTFKWDVVQIPRGKAGQFNFAGAQGQGLAPNSRHQEVAWRALQHQVSREGLLPYVKAQFGLPPLLSLRQDYLQLPAPPANRKGVIDSLAALRPLPKVPVMSEISAIYSTEMDHVFFGRRAARDAAVEIDRQVQPRLEAR